MAWGRLRALLLTPRRAVGYTGLWSYIAGMLSRPSTISIASVLRLSVFYDFDGLFQAARAFKGALVVVWRIGGLDSGAPHLSATRLATRKAHRPRITDYLIRSHAARPRLAFVYF